MYSDLQEIIQSFAAEAPLSEARQSLLRPLIDFIRARRHAAQPIRLHFICTHNSRRSHLGQIWAQAMAHYFGMGGVDCYSGGTEATALYPIVAQTLAQQGFNVLLLSAGDNPVYAVKYAENEAPVICFSKIYDHPFNPQSDFCAIITCNSADENCPVVLGAAARIPVKYEDPKAFDGTDLQSAKYAERSLEIGRELYHVFANVR